MTNDISRTVGKGRYFGAKKLSEGDVERIDYEVYDASGKLPGAIGKLVWLKGGGHLYDKVNLESLCSPDFNEACMIEVTEEMGASFLKLCPLGKAGCDHYELEERHQIGPAKPIDFKPRARSR